MVASPLNSPSSGPLLSIPSGAIAGLLATSITQPFDMIKTRIQLAPKEYRNLWYGGKKIFKVCPFGSGVDLGNWIQGVL
jgi:solute carrier family 25 protein 38